MTAYMSAGHELDHAPAGVAADPRPVMLMGDEPEYSEVLSDEAIEAAIEAWFTDDTPSDVANFPIRMRNAIRAALNAGAA